MKGRLQYYRTEKPFQQQPCVLFFRIMLMKYLLILQCLIFTIYCWIYYKLDTAEIPSRNRRCVESARYIGVATQKRCLARWLQKIAPRGGIEEVFVGGDPCYT